MKRSKYLIATVGVALAATAAPVAAAPATTIDLSGVLVTTQITPPEAGAGSYWGRDQFLHARQIHVEDAFIVDGDVVGRLERLVSFNWRNPSDTTDLVSTAHCSFTIELYVEDLGDFAGSCWGTLLSGQLVANGGTGHLDGTYALEPGGVPGVGPYLLEVSVRA